MSNAFGQKEEITYIHLCFEKTNEKKKRKSRLYIFVACSFNMLPYNA
jgi:hypothetical protein